VRPTRAVETLPLGLAILGIAVPLVGSGFDVWGFAAIWAVVISVVILGARLARPAPPIRVFAGLVALTLLFLLAYEGGWWFIPAVLAKMAIDARTARTQRSAADVR
jgi:hypothetical protein